MLPEWPAGTVAVLATAAGGRAHAIPVSTAVRAGDDEVLLALGPRRAVLQQLRDEPRVALCLHAPGVSVTAHGRAEVAAEDGPAGTVAVRIRVEDVQDHLNPRFAIDDGVRWHWTEDEAEQKDREVREGLRTLADL